jgi:hypothetical protein
MSIRIDQAGYSFVMASFLHFPVDTNCSYFAFMSGLKRVATTAGK